MEADIDGDGEVSVVEEQKAHKKSVKKEDKKNNNHNNNNNNNNGNNNNKNGNGNNNGNGGKNGKNNQHHMGLAASRVAALNGRGSGDTASAGNGGVSRASADGGIVVIGEINSGGNKGNTITVGDVGGGDGSYGGSCLGGPVIIDGGTVDNSTNIDIDAGGGTAIADSSGGSGNLAAVNDNGNDDDRGGGGPIRSRYGLGARGNGGYGGDTAAAGNGGNAGASADGGIVVIDEINSGGNQGNTIEVGDICAGPTEPVYVPVEPGKPGKPGKTIKTPTYTPGKGGKVTVTKVPSTGSGHVPAAPQPSSTALVAVLPARREHLDLDGQSEGTKP